VLIATTSAPSTRRTRRRQQAPDAAEGIATTLRALPSSHTGTPVARASTFLTDAHPRTAESPGPIASRAAFVSTRTPYPVSWPNCARRHRQRGQEYSWARYAASGCWRSALRSRVSHAKCASQLELVWPFGLAPHRQFINARFPGRAQPAIRTGGCSQTRLMRRNILRGFRSCRHLSPRMACSVRRPECRISSCTFCLSGQLTSPARWRLRGPTCSASTSAALGPDRASRHSLPDSCLWQARARHIPAVLYCRQPLARDDSPRQHLTGVEAKRLARCALQRRARGGQDTSAPILLEARTPRS